MLLKEYGDMKRIRLINIFLFSCLVLMLSGCGKDDEKLVLVTTERANTTATEEIIEEETTTESSTEEASAEEKKITLDQIYAANSGDKLLTGGKNCSVNIIYYANDKEYYSEYRYLGFDKEGNYIQAYENSDGEVRVLDMVNECWYVVEENSISTQIYPENGAFAYVVGYGHDDLIFSSSKTSGNSETLNSIYREDGELIAETNVVGTSAETYIYKYVLDENLKISTYTCFDTDGNKLAHAIISDTMYEVPEFIDQMKADGLDRKITILYKDGSVPEYTYYVSPVYPVEITLLEHEAYMDEDCTLPWKEVPPSDGKYKDTTIYLKK